MLSCSSLFESIHQDIEARLTQLVSPGDHSPLRQAMRYSLLNGGKRMRPLLTVLTAKALDVPGKLALDPACAVEMLHTASLMLDDLPCMDDAKMRRGRATTHRVFGESVTTLGAVALISEAFLVVAGARGLKAAQKTEIAAILAAAIGAEGLCGGQARDLHLAGKDVTVSDRDRVQWQKTGVLFSAALQLGLCTGTAPGEWVLALQSFGRHLGAAFQLFDDLLDIHGDPHSMGKDKHQDLRKGILPQTERIETRAREKCAAARTTLQTLDPDKTAPLAAYLDLLLETYDSQLAANRG